MNATETTRDEFRNEIRKISTRSQFQFGVAITVAIVTLVFAFWWHRQTTSQLETVQANQEQIRASQQSIDASQEAIDLSQESIQASQQSIDAGQAAILHEQTAIFNSLGELDSAFRRLNSDIDQLGRVAAGIAGKTDDIHGTLTGAGAPIEPKLPLAEDTPEPTPDSSVANGSTAKRVQLSIGIAAHDHWACPEGEDCRWMQVSHSGLGEGPWEVKCATLRLTEAQSNNADPDNHEVWRVYKTTLNPTNGCLFWHEGNTVYVIMDGVRSNDLEWNP